MPGSPGPMAGRTYLVREGARPVLRKGPLETCTAGHQRQLPALHLGGSRALAPQDFATSTWIPHSNFSPCQRPERGLDGSIGSDVHGSQPMLV